jgi:hypothetical protein
LARNEAVWNSLFLTRTESPWWIFRVDGKNRLSDACLGVPVGALVVGLPAYAVQVVADAVAGTASSSPAARAAKTGGDSLCRIEGNSFCIGEGTMRHASVGAAGKNLTA